MSFAFLFITYKREVILGNSFINLSKLLNLFLNLFIKAFDFTNPNATGSCGCGETFSV